MDRHKMLACHAGLLLYLLDVQLRLAQRAQPIQLCSVTASSNEHLATLRLHADPRWKMQPVQASIPVSSSWRGVLIGMPIASHKGRPQDYFLGREATPCVHKATQAAVLFKLKPVHAGDLHQSCSGVSIAVAPLHSDCWRPAQHLRGIHQGLRWLDAQPHQQV